LEHYLAALVLNVIQDLNIAHSIPRPRRSGQLYISISNSDAQFILHNIL